MQLAEAQESNVKESQETKEIVFYVADAETKAKLEKLLAKIGITASKILITSKKDDYEIKSELINYSKRICGGYYRGKIGKNLDIQIELVLPQNNDSYILNTKSSKTMNLPKEESQIKLYGHYSYDKYKKQILINGKMQHDRSLELKERLEKKIMTNLGLTPFFTNCASLVYFLTI